MGVQNLVPKRQVGVVQVRVLPSATSLTRFAGLEFCRLPRLSEGTRRYGCWTVHSAPSAPSAIVGALFATRISPALEELYPRLARRTVRTASGF